MGSVLQLALREIGYRKGDFLLGVVAVTCAVACLAACVTLLGGHGAWMAALDDQYREDTLALMRSVEDDYRKITVEMGYNVLVLNKAQDMGVYLDQGYATQSMPEGYVAKLADSEVMTIRHLVPTLQQKVLWKEQGDMPVILLGTRSEYPLAHTAPKKPIVEAVEKGTMRIGRVIHEKLGIGAGDTVTLLGKQLAVAQVNQLQGNEDDISVWIHLEDAQELLHRPGEINAIMALSCHCKDASLQKLQNEICGILPDTQVVQLASHTTARGKARDRAAALTAETVEAQQSRAATLRHERESLAAWLVPLVTVGAALWVGLLMLGNARARRGEIGILRALGYGTGAIMGLFFARAAWMGAFGAVAGLVAGFMIGRFWGQFDGIPVEVLAGSGATAAVVVPVIVAAPLIACAATWLPAILAARQDPAEVLRNM